jgi:hypothetical protein
MYKIYYFDQVLHLETKKQFPNLEKVKEYLLGLRRFGNNQFVIVYSIIPYNSKIVKIINNKQELENWKEF